ncbi:FtsX-like permease family protein [Lactococcus formosensis]|uniref:FtsX-like permease family protein n=1 Tax=Lactococcus formosensis TaxID=1281486 RepID=A0A9X4SE64_9LACT|nr:FtsX-like permease family protein [Lactococcus formosensis]MCO7179577.1 FtsX-like permease family protein [Lactococcus formosensis]MDG6110669.1 FtsX-like permease family protein [Lactococcus formosensis]MDG6117080.1 FtsX-like permease family protein [Lactococcus formosensis]MDG6125742.1 FtsX-like permease family protein [Lactococcus formosensis]MDG6132216.1 FtsX-like permease family protein [Lactococcus formosensis]
MLSFKLAVQNLKKGLKSFAPFIVASVTMFVLLFVTAAIAQSPSLEKMKGGAAVGEMMSFAMWILAIFGGIILIYSYRFLQLQRSREFGLYDILGLGKKKIALVSFFELVMSYIATVIIGTIVGIAFSKFLFLIFINMIGESNFNLAITPASILTVAAIFLLFFAVLLVIGTFIIWKSSSLDLLREASKGEKEPKSNIFMALIGIVLLVVGYGLALNVDNPVKALSTFFLAVLAVILGTYFFYISFTVWYLKWRKKRNSYYKPQNFITISSMLYRMKANAVGLANITILLSMTLVTLVVTIGIFLGSTQTVERSFPKEGQYTVYSQDKTGDQLAQTLQEKAEQAGVEVSNISTALSADFLMGNGQKVGENTLNITPTGDPKNAIQFSMTTLQTLKNLNENVSDISDNQINILDYFGAYPKLKEFNWFGTKHQVKDIMATQDLTKYPIMMNITTPMLLIFPNDEALHQALNVYNKANNDGEQAYQISPSVTVNFDIAEKNQEKLMNVLGDNDGDHMLSFRSAEMKEVRTGIGAFVFIGLVLGISFVLGAALIIYYKQLSEGVQDKRSFKILQEVGLSKDQVSKTIKSQVSMIFLLPIAMTIVHFSFAYIMISKLIGIFGIMDSQLILWVSLGTIAALAFVYWLIYKGTSRVYYNIVEKK